jgi:uncharacterized coiled-coil protein SlyX
VKDSHILATIASVWIVSIFTTAILIANDQQEAGQYRADLREVQARLLEVEKRSNEQERLIDKIRRQLNDLSTP